MKWTKEEIEFLKESYTNMLVKDLAKELNHTESAIHCKASELSLKKRESFTREKWGDDEIKFLKENFENMEYKEIGEKLGRTKSSCQQKANYLGLTKKYLNLDLSKEGLIKLYWEENLTTEEIGRKFGCSGTTILNLMKEYGIKRRTNSEVTKQMWKDEKFSHGVNPNLEHSPTLSYILGVIESDGCVYKTKDGNGKITLKVTSKKFAKSFCKALEEIDLNPTYWSGERESGYSNGKHTIYALQAISKLFYNWYSSLNLNNIGNIAKESDENRKSFVRGFFEGDGCNSVDKNEKREIKIEISEKEKIKMLHEILKELGFEGFHLYETKRGYYNLRNSRKKETSRFLEKINPCIKKARAGGD